MGRSTPPVPRRSIHELTTGLDPQARRDTWQLIERIRDRGVTVVLVNMREFVVPLFVLVLPVALLLGFGFQPGSRHANADLGGRTGAEYIAAIGAGIAPAILGLSVLPACGVPGEGRAAAPGHHTGALRLPAGRPARPVRFASFRTARWPSRSSW